MPPRPFITCHAQRRLTPATVLLALVTAACGAETSVEPATAPPAPAPAATDLAEIVGMAPPALGVVVSIVLFDPHAEIEVPLPDQLPVMDQYGRAFNPGFLLVHKGQTVRFTNSEDDLHTVHVRNSDGESVFNVATLQGGSYEFTFDRVGEYDVECNTHTEMFADILVVDTPYAASADREGAFTVSDVMPGTYTATVIHGEDESRREVEIVAGRNEIDLTGL